MEIRIKRGDELYGPYSLPEVRTYLSEDRLAPDDLASTDGATWRPLSDVLAVQEGGAPLVAPGFTAPRALRHYPPGALGARVGAAILDTLIGGAFLAPGLLAWAASFDVGMSDSAGVLLVAGAVAAAAYNFVKDGLRGGQSLGKRAVGLMVVHLPTNRPCSIGQSAIRTLMLFVSNLLPIVGWLIEPILVIATADRRRLGDRAASTQVINLADYREG
jgi:uncharacterized RDD family membrane protein YckC